MFIDGLMMGVLLAARAPRNHAAHVDAALGVVRSPRRYPQIEGLNSYATRHAIRVAWHVRYWGSMPSNPVLWAMLPSHLSAAEGSLVVEHVRAVAEREGWLAP